MFSFRRLCRIFLIFANFAGISSVSGAVKNVAAGAGSLLDHQPSISVKPGNSYQVNNNWSSKQVLTIFCWPGEEKAVFGFWKTATVHVAIQDEDFNIYRGENETDVRHLHDILQQSWFSFLPWKEKSISLSPFKLSCVGVYSKSDYTLRMDIRQINFNHLLMFAVGLLLYLIAPTLCEKVVFHYTTGTLIGVLGSVLIIVYLTSRLIPKKTGAIAVLVGGSSMVLYLIRSLWENLFSVMRDHQNYVVAYLLISSVVSFVICYRFGPVTNPRTIHLLQWGLQVVGLYLVFESSAHKEAAMAVIILTLIINNFPRSWSSRVLTLWFSRFPPKKRFLTEDEYLDQSRVETRKALDELRQFSKSPNCNAWRTMSRLKDPLRERPKASPQASPRTPRHVEFTSPPQSFRQSRGKKRQSSRFAEFVEGSSHLNDNEILAYETSSPDGENFTDDESDDE